MSQFLNYQVNLLLRDGNSSSGTITRINPQVITIDNRNINSCDIRDLKVISIPKKKATEDFDFAANLAMFDKKSVFEHFQQTDTVDPGLRLVSHNKKKYDNNEMVLEPSDRWDSIGNTGPIQIQKAATPPAKDLSLVDAQGQHVMVASQVQLLEVERIAAESFGVTAQMLTETCAVNLGSLVCSLLGGATRLSNKKNHNLPPLVVLLIGGGRVGARALAAGRVLTNHGIRVMAWMRESADAQTDDLSHQLSLFSRAGGKIMNDFAQMLSVIRHDLDTPVELIVDALQGYDEHLDDLFYEGPDTALLRSVVSWANAHSSKVMSLDIPSGIDGGSGTATPIKVDCRWCVSMGVPINGLLHAHKNGLMDEVGIWVVDCGIPNKVYGSKGNLRKLDGFWHCAEGYRRLEFR